MKIESLEQQISKQQERLKQLKAQKQAAVARERSKQKELERKNDTRRKILIGSCMLKITEGDEQARAKLITQMDKYLTDERDRKLFNLPLQ
ncbi:mobilization protein [Acinetobacter sp. YH16056]|uniref:mobilization protein n=1 Tax=Acinetobacter sp. YH16056 TaxID=2601194 RepID=UPI0015D1667D|nr:mobilization protein [Acinetobacter sp. YH16056]